MGKLKKYVVFILIAVLSTILLLTNNVNAAENENVENNQIGENQIEQNQEVETTPLVGETATADDDSIVWTDVTNAKITIERSNPDGDTKSSMYLKLDGLQYNKSENSSYLYIANSSDIELPTTAEALEQDKRNNKCIAITANGTQDGIFEFRLYELLNEAYNKSGDIYAWIVDVNTASSQLKTVLSAKKVERVKSLNVGSRYTVSVNKTSTSVNSEDYLLLKDRKVKVKVGVLSDASIISALNSDKNDGLNKLLAFAKTNNSIKEFTFTIDSNFGSAYNLENIYTAMENAGKDKLYYVYLEADTENGKYYSLEDVNVYKFNELGSIEVYYESNYSYKISDSGNTGTTSQDKTTSTDKLPKTGKNLAIFGVMGIVAIIGVAGTIKYRKYRGI